MTYSFTPDFRTTSKAAFAQASYELFDGLKLTGGIRRTIDDKRSRNAIGGSISFAGGPPPSEVTIPYASDHSAATTYRAGLDWQVAPRSLLYGYVATGYHGSGFNGGTAVTRPLCRPPTTNATPADFVNCDAPVAHGGR